jgi:TonB family protein
VAHGEFPEKIDRYEIKEPIGFGAMGAVYKAFDPIIKRSVAVKTLRLDVPPNSPDYRAFLERFDVEARTAGRLSHPNIVTLYDVGHEGQLPWLAMEYVDGETVAAMLQGDRLQAEVVITIVSQIASAIDYAHTEGVVHRDIKPSNVIIFGGEKVKVTDFGIAKLMDADVTHSGVMMGTPSYMSPEQAMGEDLDGRTDIFSLGVVAFEMLSGQQPFPGNNVTSILYKLVHSDPIHPDDLEVLGLLPDKWHQVFSRVLAKNPAERYPTAAAFVQDLELCLGSWFGALEGETLIVREPGAAAALLGSATLPPVPESDLDETVVVRPGDLALAPVGDTPDSGDEDETVVVRASDLPAAFESKTPTSPTSPKSPSETVTAAVPAAHYLEPTDARSVSSGPEGDELDETIAAPVLDMEKTLYAGAGVETPSSAVEETLVAPPPLPPGNPPTVTVSIRKSAGLKRVLVPVGLGAVLGLGVLAFILTRGSSTPEPAPVSPVVVPPEPPPVVTGSLKVTTDPDGASVFLNGEERGLTPLDVDTLSLGSYQVRIARSGFEDEELEAELTAESPMAALDVALRPVPKAEPPKPQPAYLRIRSVPPGARVAIDGKDAGSTPLDKARVEPGSRVVRLLQEGYLPWEDNVRARAGRTESVDAVLTPRGPVVDDKAPATEPARPEPPRVVEGSLVERGEPGVINPKCVRCPPVPYPDAAKSARLQGIVELSFLIDENGDVRDPEIVQSGGAVFDDTVLDAVKSWKYEPATKLGVRVKIRWVQRFRFQLGR